MSTAAADERTQACWSIAGQAPVDIDDSSDQCSPYLVFPIFGVLHVRCSPPVFCVFGVPHQSSVALVALVAPELPTRALPGSRVTASIYD